MSDAFYYFPPLFEFEKTDSSKMAGIILHGELSGNLRPILPVLIRNPAHGNLFIAATALIDTGSPYSLITRRISEDLGLTKIGDHKSLAYDGATEIGCYRGLLAFGKNQELHIEGNFRIFNPRNDLIDMIIGTDIFGDAKFVYNDPKGEFSLEF